MKRERIPGDRDDASPAERLVRIRELAVYVHRWLTPPVTSADKAARELARQVDALDDQLMAGDELPADWQ